MADESAGTLLELYKTAVEMADRVSARRAGANSFFVTLNTALATFMGVLSAAQRPISHQDRSSFDAFGLYVVAAAGVVLAIVWWSLLRYYRRLSAAKWDVINGLEVRLPASPFTDEWNVLHRDEPKASAPSMKSSLIRALRHRVQHREATVVEQVVPFVFVVLYCIIAVRVAIQ